MPGSRVLSDPQLVEMAELRERGWTLDRIAAHFTAAGTPVRRGSIHWQCLRVGADLPPRRRHFQPPAIAPIVRNNRVHYPFTAEEDQRLLDLEADGLSIGSIAAALGRRQSSIRARLMRLARNDARAEEAGVA